MEILEKACYQTLSTALSWMKSIANQKNDGKSKKKLKSFIFY